MSANKLLGMATSDTWNAMQRPRLAIFAPILMSFSPQESSSTSSFFG
jgi:hypothetical protein